MGIFWGYLRVARRFGTDFNHSPDVVRVSAIGDHNLTVSNGCGALA